MLLTILLAGALAWRLTLPPTGTPRRDELRVFSRDGEPHSCFAMPQPYCEYMGHTRLAEFAGRVGSVSSDDGVFLFRQRRQPDSVITQVTAHAGKAQASLRTYDAVAIESADRQAWTWAAGSTGFAVAFPFKSNPARMFRDRVMVCSFDCSGSENWRTPLGEDSMIPACSALSITSDGNVCAAGAVRHLSDDATAPADIAEAGLLVRLAPNGQELWRRTAPAELGCPRFLGVAAYSMGQARIAVAGASLPDGEHYWHSQNSRCLLALYATDGRLVRHRIWGSPGSGLVTVAYDLQGTLYGIGYVPGTPAQVVLMRFSETGEVKWQRAIGSVSASYQDYYGLYLWEMLNHEWFALYAADDSNVRVLEKTIPPRGYPWSQRVWLQAFSETGTRQAYRPLVRLDPNTGAFVGGMTWTPDGQALIYCVQQAK